MELPNVPQPLKGSRITEPALLLAMQFAPAGSVAHGATRLESFVWISIYLRK
jgi:hypothetical protein